MNFPIFIVGLFLIVSLMALCLAPFLMIYMQFFNTEDVRIIQLNDGSYKVQRGVFFIKRYQTWFDCDCRYSSEWFGWDSYGGSSYTLEKAIDVREKELKRIKDRKIEELNSKSKGVVR